MDLMCMGAGAAEQGTRSTVYNGSEWANVTGSRSIPFEDQVNLWLENGEGRIRMPGSMLPPIRGGENGWFKIKNVKISDTEITGSVAVNLVNNPKLRIDRVTGAISLSGRAGDYTGRCQKYDPATAQRAF